MLRRGLLIGGALVAGLVALVIAAIALILATGPGHAVARRLAVAALERAVDGRVRIGSFGGTLWRTIELRDVELSMPDGRPVIRVPRLAARYSLTDLLRGRYVAARVELYGPTVVLEPAADGRLNIEHLFRLGSPPGPSGPRPVVDLHDVHLAHGSVTLRERAARGAMRERRFLGVALDLARLRASDPDSAGVAIDVRHLAVAVSDPAARVKDASGHVVIEGDSVRFDLAHLALPGTSGLVHGVVRWGAGAAGGRAGLEFAADLRRASFADFRWAAPGLPGAGGGRVAVRARMLGKGGSEWTFRDADLKAGRSSVRGTVDLVVAPSGGVTLRALDLTAAPLDLALLTPFLGRMPVVGTVGGHLTASGPLTALDVREDLTFYDERVPGRPANTVAGSGVVSLGGPDGFTFHHFAVAASDLSMLTVQKFAPPVMLQGRLAAVGDLDGPWQAATFGGTLVHRDGPGASRLHGKLLLAFADTLHIDADLVADSVSLDDVGRSYPRTGLVGMVAGPVRLLGPVGALAVTATLAGPGGGLHAEGEIAARDSAVRIRVGGTLDSVDLARRLPGAPATRLTGTWHADVLVPTADTAAAITGSLALALDSGRVSGAPLDRAGARITLTAERLVVDTIYAEQRSASLFASGALGRAGQPAGQLRFALRADTLASLAPVVAWARRTMGDTTRLDVSGAGRVGGRLVGTTAAWVVQGDLAIDSIGYGGVAAVAARVSGSLERNERGFVFGLRAAADSVAIAGMRYDGVSVAATGPLDSLRLHFGGAFGSGSSIETDLALRVDSGGWAAHLSGGRLALPGRVWVLARPTSVAATADQIVIDSLELRAQSGGRIRIAGALPRAARGDLSLAADSVPLADVYALAELDTTGIGGLLSVTVRLQGAATDPRIAATASLTEGRFGDFRAPLVDGSATYAAHRLTVGAVFQSGAERVLTASGSLPLDLSLGPVARRQLPDFLRIRIQADSADLAILDALTPLVRGVGGRLFADVSVGGTWDQPELTGSARISGAAVGIPGLGVRYTGIEARLSLSGNRLLVEDARLRGGPGTLEIGGDVRFAALNRPMLDLTLKARGFAAFSQRDFAGLTASGDLKLSGPVVGATLTGGLVVDAGFLAFADLVEKRIVNLDDPEFRAVVDSNLAQATGLGPSVPNVFLDSLRIRALTVAMGPDVWLRSHEANIQLAGNFTVAKDVEVGASRYRLDGTLRAVRGTYRLVVGPTAKEFRVTRGTVRFFGTPDLNPVLDIAAEHTVRSVNGGDLVIRAVIGGTLLVPKLSLESDERPPLSETEIVSYLLFGRPSFDLAAGGGTATGTSEQAIFQGAMAGLAGALSGELEQTLVTNLGIPVDYLAIRPGGGSVGDIFSSTRVEAGTQIGERTFLTLNAGLCQVARGLSSQALGASVEHRLTGRLSVEASIEPTSEECRPVGFQIRPPAPYQIGFDLFWQWGTP